MPRNTCPIYRALAIGGLIALIAACSAPPDFESARRPDGPGAFPDIKPLNEVLAVAGEPGLEPADTAALQTRAAALQARAMALSATGPDAATRARLDAAIAASGG